MAFQLIFNGVELTVNGPIATVVQFNNDGTVKNQWPSLFEAMRDLPSLERQYSQPRWVPRN